MVFDLETSSNRRSDAEILQLGALALNPANLEIIDGSEFELKLKPLRPDLVQDSALAANGLTREEIEKGVDPSEGWHRFAEWARQWNVKGKNDRYSNPIPAGHNIVNFDLPIYDRYCLKYKTTRTLPSGEVAGNIFSDLYKYDILQMLAGWTENLPDFNGLSMDKLRRYFSMPRGQGVSHTALQDCRDAAAILVKLLRLTRECSPKVIWKDAFDEVKVQDERQRRADAKQASKEKEAARREAAEKRERVKYFANKRS